MANPGEVNQAIGRTYQYAFIAALEASIAEFENLYSVETEPNKVSFPTRTGTTYSFDFSGVLRTPFGQIEVLAESKGYSRASNLLAEYRTFLAKAYVTTTDHLRHRKDYFWFVTNVPFACNEGITKVRGVDFVDRALRDTSNEEVRHIVGAGFIDRDIVHGLVDRLGVFILTDSFLTTAKLSYKALPGDSLWKILKRFHAGHIPYNFGTVCHDIARRNGLESPDKILSGQRISIPCLGIPDEIALVPLQSSQSGSLVEFMAADAPQSDGEG